MRTLIVILIALFCQELRADEGFAMGINLGVAQMRHKSDRAVGSAWAFEVDYETDEFFSIFGQAGQEKADEISLNMFGGGMILTPMPFLALKLGVSINSWESNFDGHKVKDSGASPLAAVTFQQQTTGFRYGTSLSATRTGDFQSTALLGFLMIEMN